MGFIERGVRSCGDHLANAGCGGSQGSIKPHPELATEPQLVGSMAKPDTREVEECCGTKRPNLFEMVKAWTRKWDEVFEHSRQTPVKQKDVSMTENEEHNLVETTSSGKASPVGLDPLQNPGLWIQALKKYKQRTGHVNPKIQKCANNEDRLAR